MNRITHKVGARNADTYGTSEPRERGADTLRGTTTTMDIFSNIAPYLRARFGNTERGAALVEYALLLALIAVVCIVALTTLGGKASSKFNAVGNSLN
jgi:pilus assembly protein Flp/PilA